jgi:SAM-dependent methyltransferase
MIVTPEARRLHIGSGTRRIPGFLNLDVDGSLPGVDIVGDVRDLSGLGAGSFSSIYLSHVLEHIPVADVEGVLAELHRILAEGGELRASVPDLDKICRLYVAKAGFCDIREVGPSEEYGVLDGSFASRPFGPISVTVTARKGIRSSVSTVFRPTAPERILMALEEILDKGVTLIVRLRLGLIRRRRRLMLAEEDA